MHNGAEYCILSRFVNVVDRQVVECSVMDGRLISEALSAARSVLRDLEPSDVPVRLRKVAASSAKRLPVPLETALISAIDEHAWLRDKALDVLADSAGTASRIFLDRSDGWDAELERLESEVAAVAEDRTVEALNRQLEAVTSQRDQARAKARLLQSSLDKLQLQQRISLAARRSDENRTVGVDDHLSKRVVELESEVQTLRTELEELRTQLEDREQRLERSRADLLKARRVGASPAALDGSGVSIDPIGLAQTLDRIAVTARPDAQIGEIERAVEPAAVTGLALPLGVGPDSAAAVTYLSQRTEPTWVIVDGYNASFHVDAIGFATKVARSRVRAGLASLRNRAAGRMRVTVVWDSAEDPSDGPSDGGIEQRFVADADEEVRRLSREATGDAVVISTDREVHAGVAAGTLVLWSEALAAWLRDR